MGIHWFSLISFCLTMGLLWNYCRISIWHHRCSMFSVQPILTFLDRSANCSLICLGHPGSLWKWSYVLGSASQPLEKVWLEESDTYFLVHTTTRSNLDEIIASIWDQGVMPGGTCMCQCRSCTYWATGNPLEGGAVWDPRDFKGKSNQCWYKHHSAHNCVVVAVLTDMLEVECAPSQNSSYGVETFPEL